jgi:(4-alkanoyl-5-oxo-2,5-dihydrofuran-3-yl)methyl phosphate reductase
VPIAAIDPADIAAVAATVLTEPGPPERRAVTQRPRAAHTGQQVETLTKVLTRPLRYQPLSDEQARSEMAADTPPTVHRCLLPLLHRRRVRNVDSVAGFEPATFGL